MLNHPQKYLQGTSVQSLTQQTYVYWDGAFYLLFKEKGHYARPNTTCNNYYGNFWIKNNYMAIFYYDKTDSLCCWTYGMDVN